MTPFCLKHMNCFICVHVEVDAFCCLHKKSAELKSKLKSLRCKNIDIATFNVRTLNQLAELTASAAEHNTDIKCTQEHGYYHSKLEIKYHDICNG